MRARRVRVKGAKSERKSDPTGEKAAFSHAIDKRATKNERISF